MKKVQSSKNEKDKTKEKNKQKEKENEKDNKKDKKKVEEESDSEEYYTEEEIKMLDKFHLLSENKFTDDEIYDVMVRFNNDEELIKNEINEMLKVFKRGDEFNWTEIGKSNSIFF
jgi:hypothetical protein